MTKLAYSVLNPEATDLPTLIFGPPLGTHASVWASVAARLADDFRVVLTELPGHGADAGRDFSAEEPVTVASMARGVVQIADELGADTFGYAGCSISGGVAQELALNHSDRVRAAAPVATAAKFGEPQDWHDRIAGVREDGIAPAVPDTLDLWFAAGFLSEDIAAGHIAAHQLLTTPEEAYIACCEALADYDLSERTADIAVPTLWISAAQDVVNTPESMEQLAETAQNGTHVTIPDAAHVFMIEHPELAADHLGEFFRNHL